MKRNNDTVTMTPEYVEHLKRMAAWHRILETVLLIAFMTFAILSLVTLPPVYAFPKDPGTVQSGPGYQRSLDPLFGANCCNGPHHDERYGHIVEIHTEYFDWNPIGDAEALREMNRKDAEAAEQGAVISQIRTDDDRVAYYDETRGGWYYRDTGEAYTMTK